MTKKLIILVCILSYFLTSNAQDTTKFISHIKVDLGTLIGTSTHYEQQGYSSSANGLYHIGIGYSLKSNNLFSISIGPRLDYYSKLIYNDKNAFLTSIFLQGHLNLNREPKTFYLYGNYGIAPKIGGNFYAGSIVEFGLGWQYQPKFISKNTLSFAIGYNSTHLKDVYAERHTSFDGINISKTSGYYRLGLKSVALNIGISF